MLERPNDIPPHLGHFLIKWYQMISNSTETNLGIGKNISAEEIRLAVFEATKPLAREISELKDKIRTSDIIGGIGFIVGLLGFYAFLKFRKESQTN